MLYFLLGVWLPNVALRLWKLSLKKVTATTTTNIVPERRCQTEWIGKGRGVTINIATKTFSVPPIRLDTQTGDGRRRDGNGSCRLLDYLVQRQSADKVHDSVVPRETRV